MYITVTKQNEMRNIVSSTIDDMFATLDVPEDEELATEIRYTNTDTIRNKTYKTRTVHVRIPDDTWNLFKNKIDFIYQQFPEPESEYITFRIPKRTHGFRTINAPKDGLKQVQKEIAQMLEARPLNILSHDNAWAYVKGRDVVGAMKEHKANDSRWFLKIDLHDFFGSCSPEIIKNRLLQIYPFAIFPDAEEVIDKIIHIACLNGGLPQGTPLSPTLTNLLMVPSDYEINRAIYNLTKENKLFKQKYIYTRYADDIIISAKNKFEYEELINKLKEVLAPFEINDEKTRFGSSSGRNWNLGVMYNKENKVTVGHKRKHDVKLLVFNYVKQDNEWDIKDYQYLLGQLSWIRNVEPEYCKQLLQYFRNKYNIDVWHNLVADIKRLSNN